jgi:hypothetical protein
MDCKRLYFTFPLSTHHLGSLLDPRIKGSFVDSYGSDEKSVLQAAKDVISSHYRTICNNLLFSFHPLFSQLFNRQISHFLFQDKEDTGCTKANEREGETQASKRSKHSRPILSTLLQPRPQPSGAVREVLVELDD